MNPSRYIFTDAQLVALRDAMQSICRLFEDAVATKKTLTPLQEWTTQRRNRLGDEVTSPEMFYRIDYGIHHMEVRPVGRPRLDLKEGIVCHYTLWCTAFKPRYKSYIGLNHDSTTHHTAHWFDTFQDCYGDFKTFDEALIAFVDSLPDFISDIRNSLI